MASQSNTDFLSRMSHDIRTPMNGIVSMTNIDRRKIDDSEAVLSALAKPLDPEMLLSVLGRYRR